MLRRVAALLLIATSAWLLYQTATTFLGGPQFILSERFVAMIGDAAFLAPFIGGVLGLLGGLTIFFAGPGGAALAMVGGVVVAGFAFSLKQTIDLTHIWENEAAVGVTILVLAGLAAVMGRN